MSTKVENTELWNLAFTALLRQVDSQSWGNFSLNTLARAGAVGILDSGTGSFQKITDMPGLTIAKTSEPLSNTFESTNVSRTESSVDFKGGYLDPTSGLEVNVGLDVTWNFAEENGIASDSTVAQREVVDNFAIELGNNFKWLLGQAEAAGYGDGQGGIKQGFGVITEAQLVEGCVNVASETANNSFSIIGSVDGVQAMTGGGTVNAQLKGSYKNTTEKSSVVKFLFPADENSISDDTVAISYIFTSFAGKQIIPSWTKLLPGYTLNFNNNHGGTYIAHPSVSYVDPAGNTIPVDVNSISGGLTTSCLVPVDAASINVSITFAASSYKYSQTFVNPLQTLYSGTSNFDIYGVWPWKITVDESHVALRG